MALKSKGPEGCGADRAATSETVKFDIPNILPPPNSVKHNLEMSVHYRELARKFYKASVYHAKLAKGESRE